MGTYELLLRSGFSAAHRLRRRDGQTEPLHAHDWQVEVFLVGRKLDEDGLVADFTVLQEQLSGITARLQDTCLNDLPAFSECNPSTEVLAKEICEHFGPALPPDVRISKVRVWETDDCAAAYVPSLTGTRNAIGLGERSCRDEMQ